MWSLIVLGVLVALAGLAHMARPDMAVADYAMGVFGVLMFISPWVMNFHALEGAALDSLGCRSPHRSGGSECDAAMNGRQNASRRPRSSGRPLTERQETAHRQSEGREIRP